MRFFIVASVLLLALAAVHGRQAAAAVAWDCKPAYELLAIQATQTAVERDEWRAKANRCQEKCW